MQNLPDIDQNYLQNILTELLNIPSPTGYTNDAINYSKDVLKGFADLELSSTHKGALVAKWAGEQGGNSRGLTAHLDTLGAMVKEIKTNGRLKLTKLGGFPWNTVEGEGCTVLTNSGKKIRGSILLTKSSVHVYGKDVSETKRDDDHIEVRLDIRTTKAEETRSYGIDVGDFVFFDPRVEIGNGFVRSRHLDDKACVAVMMSVIKTMQDNDLQPVYETIFHISNYEEVGHGAAAGFPDDMTELVSLDMAAIGKGQSSDEFNATLCVKDSGGPYHNGLSNKLRNIADKAGIAYKVDIYPYYGSDGEAFWRAGGDVAVALLGPGVDASHNYERTHIDALVATTQWVIAYLLTKNDEN